MVWQSEYGEGERAWFTSKTTGLRTHIRRYHPRGWSLAGPCSLEARRFADTHHKIYAERCAELGLSPHPRTQPKKDPGKFLLTYPGSLNWHQGLDIAIRAFASVAGQMPDAQFHIYGEGPAKPSLIELTSQLGMQEHIFFHDFLSSRAIAKVMAATDLAIEPKRANSSFSNEALSTKILEFMSLGVPVIACRTRIHAYYYDDSIIQYYENDDEKELAEQMLRLANDPILRARLAANAEIYVRNNTWDARKHEYLALIDSLVQPKVHTHAN